MKNRININPFSPLIPTTFTDSLTYLEQLHTLKKKVNEVITALNNAEFYARGLKPGQYIDLAGAISGSALFNGEDETKINTIINNTVNTGNAPGWHKIFSSKEITEDFKTGLTFLFQEQPLNQNCQEDKLSWGILKINMVYNPTTSQIDLNTSKIKIVDFGFEEERNIFASRENSFKLIRTIDNEGNNKVELFYNVRKVVDETECSNALGPAGLFTLIDITNNSVLFDTFITLENNGVSSTTYDVDSLGGLVSTPICLFDYDDITLSGDVESIADNGKMDDRSVDVEEIEVPQLIDSITQTGDVIGTVDIEKNHRPYTDETTNDVEIQTQVPKLIDSITVKNKGDVTGTGSVNVPSVVDNPNDITIEIQNEFDEDRFKELVEDYAPEYELPIASSTVLGGVKIGNNLSIDSDGVLSATGGGGGSGPIPPDDFRLLYLDLENGSPNGDGLTQETANNNITNLLNMNYAKRIVINLVGDTPTTNDEIRINGATYSNITLEDQAGILRTCTVYVYNSQVTIKGTNGTQLYALYGENAKITLEGSINDISTFNLINSEFIDKIPNDPTIAQINMDNSKYIKDIGNNSACKTSFINGTINNSELTSTYHTFNISFNVTTNLDDLRFGAKIQIHDVNIYNSIFNNISFVVSGSYNPSSNTRYIQNCIGSVVFCNTLSLTSAVKNHYNIYNCKFSIKLFSQGNNCPFDFGESSTWPKANKNTFSNLTGNNNQGISKLKNYYGLSEVYIHNKHDNNDFPASSSKYGLVKVDGTTITADSDGTIHAVGGSGGGVNSVNGQTGAVVLDANDINADNSQSIQDNLERIDGAINDINGDIQDIHTFLDDKEEVFIAGTGLEKLSLSTGRRLNVKIDGTTIRTNAAGQLEAVGGSGGSSFDLIPLTRDNTTLIVYISETGSDLTGDGTQYRPFATVEKALNSIRSKSHIELRLTNYTNPISDVYIDGTGFDSIVLNTLSNVSIQNLTIDNCKDLILDASFITITGNFKLKNSYVHHSDNTQQDLGSPTGIVLENSIYTNTNFITGTVNMYSLNKFRLYNSTFISHKYTEHYFIEDTACTVINSYVDIYGGIDSNNPVNFNNSIFKLVSKSVNNQSYMELMSDFSDYSVINNCTFITYKDNMISISSAKLNNVNILNIDMNDTYGSKIYLNGCIITNSNIAISEVDGLVNTKILGSKLYGLFNTSASTSSNNVLGDCDVNIYNSQGGTSFIALMDSITAKNCNILCPATDISSIHTDTTFKSLINGVLT